MSGMGVVRGWATWGFIFANPESLSQSEHPHFPDGCPVKCPWGHKLLESSFKISAFEIQTA